MNTLYTLMFRTSAERIAEEEEEEDEGRGRRRRMPRLLLLVFWLINCKTFTSEESFIPPVYFFGSFNVDIGAHVSFLGSLISVVL